MMKLWLISYKTKNVSIYIYNFTSPNFSLIQVYVHYDKNRKQRRDVRSDVPVAKSIQQTEYQELLRRHELLEKL